MPPGKSWIFLQNFQALESPGKWIWSWNFLLGYEAGDRHNGIGVGADAEICVVTICLRFLSDVYLNMDAVIIGCIYMWLVTSVCLYLHVAGV